MQTSNYYGLSPARFGYKIHPSQVAQTCQDRFSEPQLMSHSLHRLQQWKAAAAKTLSETSRPLLCVGEGVGSRSVTSHIIRCPGCCRDAGVSGAVRWRDRTRTVQTLMPRSPAVALQMSTSVSTKPSVATTASARTRTAPSAASVTKATPTRRRT